MHDTHPSPPVPPLTHLSPPLPSHAQGHDLQIEYIESLCPPALPPDRWSALVEDRAHGGAAFGRSSSSSYVPGGGGGSSSGGGSGWDEMLYSWVCLHSMLLRSREAAAAEAEAASRSGATNGSSGGGSGGGDVQAVQAAAFAGRPVPDLDRFLLSMHAVESR